MNTLDRKDLIHLAAGCAGLIANKLRRLAAELENPTDRTPRDIAADLRVTANDVWTELAFVAETTAAYLRAYPAKTEWARGLPEPTEDVIEDAPPGGAAG